MSDEFDFSDFEEEIRGTREEFFARLASRMTPKNYLWLRDHFEEHISDANSGVEGAYLCLSNKLLTICDSMNRYQQEIYKVMTGEYLESSPPTKEEP